MTYVRVINSPSTHGAPNLSVFTNSFGSPCVLCVLFCSNSISFSFYSVLFVAFCLFVCLLLLNLFRVHVCVCYCTYLELMFVFVVVTELVLSLIFTPVTCCSEGVRTSLFFFIVPCDSDNYGNSK